MRKNQSSEKRFELIATIILILMTFVALMPILLIVIASFTDEKSLLAGGYTYLPKKLSFNAYYYMLKQGALIFRSYGISFLVTVIGTVSSVLLTTMIAYPMSRKNFKYRNILAFVVFFTMLFNGGIVSSYMLWSRFLHIKNTIWALIIPNYLVTGFNIFLVRNYYANAVPDSLIESAQIDGATEIKIFGKIMFPLAVPTVATISLFTGLGYWNDWINGLYYITEPKFFGIQNLLIRIMNNIQFLKTGTIANALGTGSVELPGTAVRMAMAVIGILPIVIIYPFVQKYFIKGVVIGAVKG